MSLNLLPTTLAILKTRPGQRLTGHELAEIVFKENTEACRDKQSRSTARKIPLDTDQALVQQIAAEIAAFRSRLQERHPEIKTSGERPRYYFYSTDSDEVEVAKAEGRPTPNAATVTSPAEKELYPKLVSFLWSEYGIRSKRIDEKRSSNSKGAGANRWLFPDIVGLEDLTSNWDTEIRLAAQEMNAKKARLWSFEVKRLLNRSNVREAYFQAVSNSTWANFGYLVAAEIHGDAVMPELRMLAGLHGVGLIEINANDPSDSWISIPARERLDVDWNAANRLCKQNADFLAVVRNARQFHQTGEHPSSVWDTEISEE